MIFRVKLRPLSPWQTPWQADTLAGMLAATLARWEGGETLRKEILLPALAGDPPFVLSDAFPEGLLPIPLSVRLLDWPSDKRKDVKRARYVSARTLQRWRDGAKPVIEDLIAESPLVGTYSMRNTISRQGGSTQDEGGLFSAEEVALRVPTAYMSVYMRVAPHYEDRLLQLLRRLELTGFGADASVGRGQFALASGLEPQPHLDVGGGRDDGVLSLSTFSPAAADPTDGCWEMFIKHGKLGPDFGIPDVFKRPLALLRPGACFLTDRPRQFLGRVLAMEEFLAPETASYLSARGAHVFHYAFGLVMPFPYTSSL